MVFNIEGIIIHMFEAKCFSSRLNEFETFIKHEIVVETSDGIFTLTFNDKKTELLKDSHVGSKIKAEGYLKGHIWRKNGITYSRNELRCLKLKLITKKLEIEYNGHIYQMQKYYYDGYLRLKLISISNDSTIDFTAVGVNEAEKEDYILFLNYNNEKLLQVLISLGILIHIYDLHQYQAASGYVCKVLVLDKFVDNFLTI